MEKLELKHLAGYLPYGLSTDKGRLSLLEGDYCEVKKAMISTRYLCEGIKPILRPLADLTKEIEVNGVKFIPADIINKDFFWDYVRNNMRALVKDESYILVGYLPALVVDKLLEWHFDIYGLVEKGLAIDINNLK